MASLNIAIEIAAKDAASSVIGSITNALGGLGNLASGALTVGLGAAAAGVAGLGAGLTLAISEAMGAQEVMAQTEAVIKSTGGAAGMTADSIAELAGAISQNSRFSDDAIQQGENLLLTFTNIGSDVFPAATQAMVDMATAMGTDAKGGAIQLGKALNDPVAGISALSRVGVSFTEDQKKMIESMVEAGDVAGAQKIILEELNKEFGGSAAASAQTFAGRLDVMKNQLLNVAEAIGGPLLTIGADLMDRFLTPAIPMIEGVGGVVEALVATFGGLTDPTEKFLTLWENTSEVFGPQVADAVTGVAEAIDWMVTAIGKGASFDQIVGGLKDFSWDDIFGPEIGSIINGVLTNIQTFGNTIQSVFTSFQPVVQAFSDLWSGTLAPAFAQVFGDVTAGAPTMQQVFDGAMQGITVGAQVVADFLVNVAIPAIKSVVDWFILNWPQIKATGEQVMAGLQSAIETVAGAIKSFWDEWGDDILSLWQGVVDNVQGAFDLFKLAFEGKWYEFGEGLRKGWDEKWAAIQGIVQAGIDWFNTQDWGAIGTAILQGLANGITAATHFVVEAATAAAQAAFDAAKGFLGISSPSKKFEWLGMNSALGYAEGMDSYAPRMAYASVGAATGAYNAAAATTTGGGSMVFNIDARGATNAPAMKAAIKAGVTEALQEAGLRSDRMRRTG